MAWEKVGGYPAFVGIQPSGRVEWNDASQAMMRDPESVEIFHDSVANKMGFRRLLDTIDIHALKVNKTTNADTGLEVFSIEAFQHLSNMGVSVGSLYAASLQYPLPPPEEGQEPGVFWIDLP